MQDYFNEGAVRAMALPNRGPLRFERGRVHADILDAYRKYGFYVLEGAIGALELADLQHDFDQVMARAPVRSGSDVDAQGRPSIDQAFERATFQFAKPLSDPMGGTAATGGRYPVKMAEYDAPDDAPDEVLLQISGSLQMMDANLRLYGHPELLRVAEAINGLDFVPFTDAVWVKPARYGAAVSCTRTESPIGTVPTLMMAPMVSISWRSSTPLPLKMRFGLFLSPMTKVRWILRV